MRRCPLRRHLLPRAELKRQAQVAIMARAHVATGADMRPRGTDEPVVELALIGGSGISLDGVRRTNSRGRQVHNASGAAIAESMIKSCSAKSASSAHRPRPRRAASEDRAITWRANVAAAAHAGSMFRREACDTSVGFEHSGKFST
eukprot:5815632-Pleurochrysis_carterae.AAC.2